MVLNPRHQLWAPYSRRERESSFSPAVEILSLPERVGEVKIKNISPSTEGGVGELISFNYEDLLQLGLDCSPEAKILLSEVELRGGQTFTNTDTEVANFFFLESDSTDPSLEPLSSISTGKLDIDPISVSEGFWAPLTIPLSPLSSGLVSGQKITLFTP